MGLNAGATENRTKGEAPKVRWEAQGVANFPCFCASWEEFELELGGRQFFFRCILVPDTQPFTVNHRTGAIVHAASPRSTSILDPDLSIRRYRCEHAKWPTGDTISSDKTGCQFFLIAIKPFAHQNGVYVQIGRQKSEGASESLTRNYVSFHNHRVKSLWLSHTEPTNQPSFSVHAAFFPDAIITEIVQSIHQMLVEDKSRLVHLTQPMLDRARSIVNRHVGKWEKQLSQTEKPLEWLTEVCKR
jgi:hypothetical protein